MPATKQKRPLGVQISHMLKDRGVDVIFGIPGVHNQEMYRGIEEAGITHVLARHEQGAGFMADGYARATGRPGVAYVITGPGLCNIMTPMGQAYSDSVPLLVISSCLDETSARRGQLHQMRDQRLAGATVCDWSEEVRTADAAYRMIDRALVEFATERRRPKHLSVTISALEGEAEAFAPGQGDVPATSAAPSAGLAAIDAVARQLSQAQRPLLVFGGGAVHAAEAARAVLASLGAASFATYAGRGIVAPEDPLYLGSYLARPGSAEVFASADCLLFVGTDLAEVDLWRTDPGHGAPAIIVNTDPEVLADGRTGDTRLRMDAGDFLAALADRLEGATASSWTGAEVADLRRAWKGEVSAEYPGIVPVCEALKAALPEGAMVYSDMTQIAYTATEVWDMDRPGHWHHPYGFGTLGYALPAGIGGAVARPGQPTVVIAGDYGFQYTIQELAVAVELGLTLPIILWDNDKLKQIEDSMVRAQIAPNAVTQKNPDFAKLAEAYGAGYAQPASLDEIGPVLAEALTAGRPTIIRLTPAITA
ncbi:thiamine pyrophosphate-binding protein [Albibacillus kandeliae]|uniref:thiamine pyrophosphate-binding protein n=1 Tax=Albibacillus kandeliae TaxID=2174228 RepID=UPI001E5E24E9|nr:thiamine pyrophosphate-binding protein [Albibacillus kandeliae]